MASFEFKINTKLKNSFFCSQIRMIARREKRAKKQIKNNFKFKKKQLTDAKSKDIETKILNIFEYSCINQK